MTLYTGRGDDGLTDLRDASRVSKTATRIEAYGTVDELNALLGTVRSTGQDDVDETLATVQNHLHVLQAEFATPDPGPDDPTLGRDRVERIEALIDEYDDEVPPLDSFILPGGSESAADLHHARAVCRRAERRALALAEESGDVEEASLTYLNRLSDLLFAMARALNHRHGISESAPSY